MPSSHEAALEHANAILGMARASQEGALPALVPDLAAALLAASNAGTEINERERAERMRALLDDPVGQAFVSALTDRAHRSSSGLRLVEQVEQLLDLLGAPRSLPAWDRLELRALRAFGSSVPELTARAVRRRIYEDAIPYLAPADPQRLATFLAERTEQGLRVNLNRLGEEVLGDADAERFLEAYLELLARPEVNTISVKLSSIDARIDLAAWDATVARLSEKLVRIYRAALDHPVARPDGTREPKLVYLDMEAYRDLDLTVELFTRVLARPELRELTAGIVLQAYLPDSHAKQAELLRFARERVRHGGAPIRQRLVKGANLMMERIDAALRGLSLVTYRSKRDVDASFRHMLSVGSLAEHAACVRLGVGSHNLFDIAYALLLREARAIGDALELEMLEGMADPLRRVVQRIAGRVLVYAPSVDERDFPSAVAYLVRRLDENTAEDNFLRRSFAMHVGDAGFVEERERFARALAVAPSVSTEPFRHQDRRAEPARAGRAGFENEPDTDPSLADNRAWLAELLARGQKEVYATPVSRVGGETLGGSERAGFDPSRPGEVPYRYAVADRAMVTRAVELAEPGARAWAATPAEEREHIVLAVADELRRARAELVRAMVLDAGKRALEADAEVSEAVDFAEYYARQHARLRERLVLEPKGLVVVTPPWNFPLSIALGSTLAALVAGNGVLLKPPPETPLVLAIAASLLFRAGVPETALGLVLAEDEAAGPLVTDRRVATVVLTGGTETAQLFLRLRPELDLVAETGGKNAIIVSAMSDREQAVQHVVRSAFGHAGQKCSACSLLVLEREVYRSASFREKLADATQSLAVGSAWNPESVVTPLIRPPAGPLARALSSLDADERWLVSPRRDPRNERLVSPGVRYGVLPGSFAHRTELFGPVLSVMEADDFEHALALANDTAYGLTAGLESLDEKEQQRFLAAMQAGNLYVNRPITGAIVGRQPFGGHKASSFGAGYKAGGPNTLLSLVRVTGERDRGARGAVPLGRGPCMVPDPPRASAPRPELDLGPFSDAVAEILRDAAPADRERLARRLKSYERALELELLPEHAQDRVLGHEDVFCYRPCRVAVVVLTGTTKLDAVSTLLAARLVGAGVRVLVEGDGGALDPALLAAAGAELVADLDAARGVLAAETWDWVRVVGERAAERRVELAGLAPGSEAGPVSDSGYVELRRYVIEQSRSVARHRHGNMSLELALLGVRAKKAP